LPGDDGADIEASASRIGAVGPDPSHEGKFPMSASRREDLAAAGAFDSIHGAASPIREPAHGQFIADLVQRSEASNAALMRGDIDGYRAMISLTEDFTLMAPVGGKPTHARDMTPARWAAMGRFFRNGSLRHELVQAYASDDMVVLALIEHAHVEVGGLPAQHWSLRVTLAYRRDGTEWRLAHRHADPLVAGISLEQSAALAGGRC
jgi:ketosteroid isomerase-like protein